MENVKKEIEELVNNVTDKDLLIRYLVIIAKQEYLRGKSDLLNEYDIKLKQK